MGNGKEELGLKWGSVSEGRKGEVRRVVRAGKGTREGRKVQEEKEGKKEYTLNGDASVEIQCSNREKEDYSKIYL